MSIFSKLFTADPNASDPAIAAAAGITRDHNGILQQQHTPESDQLAHNLGAIAGTAWAPVMEGMLVPQVSYSAIPRSLQYNPAMPTVLNRAQYVLRSTTPTIAKTTMPSVVNTSKHGLTGAIALGVAAGQGATSPSQRNRSIVAPKAPVTTKKYMQPSYERLLALSKVYGGNLIKQKDGTYFLKNKNGSFFW